MAEPLDLIKKTDNEGHLAILAASKETTTDGAPFAVVRDNRNLFLGDDGDIAVRLKTAALDANTAVTGILEGTPAVSALAANSLIISNRTASGDIVIAANRGGNSESYIEIDSSTGSMTMQPRGSGILTITGPTISAPILSGTATGTYTLAGTPTITSPTISGPILSGSVTGTYTLAGTPTLTAPAINTATMTGSLWGAETKQCTTTFSATNGTTGTTLTDVTGLGGWSLTAGGIYQFEIDLQCVCTTNAGIGVALKYTTATASAMQMAIYTGAASSMVEARSTTTADSTLYVNNKNAAWLHIRLTGTMTVGTGGTVKVQAAQETAHSDTTSVYVGSYGTFRRLS